MQRALDAVDRDTADLITTLVASAFVDGRNEGVAEATNPAGWRGNSRSAGSFKKHPKGGRKMDQQKTIEADPLTIALASLTLSMVFLSHAHRPGDLVAKSGQQLCDQAAQSSFAGQ
jgi:hypothetical protein